MPRQLFFKIEQKGILRKIQKTTPQGFVTIRLTCKNYWTSFMGMRDDLSKQHDQAIWV